MYTVIWNDFEITFKDIYEASCFMETLNGAELYYEDHVRVVRIY